MPRLAPTLSTVKKLFALSGNCCAFPGCKDLLVDTSGDLQGEICHIEAAEPGGPALQSQIDRYYSQVI